MTRADYPMFAVFWGIWVVTFLILTWVAGRIEVGVLFAFVVLCTLIAGWFMQ